MLQTIYYIMNPCIACTSAEPSQQDTANLWRAPYFTFSTHPYDCAGAPSRTAVTLPHAGIRQRQAT